MTHGRVQTEIAPVGTLKRVRPPNPEPEQSLHDERPGASPGSDWQPRNSRGPTRKRTEILTYASGVVGILELWLLGRTHVVAERPLWLLLAVLAGAAGTGWVGDKFY